jgi:hypothetical protein
MPNYILAQMDEIAPVSCPCGFARRAFVSPDTTLPSTRASTITKA